MVERSGNLQAAVQLYRAALAREEKASGPDNTKTAMRLNDLGVAARDPELLRRSLGIEERAFGPVHPAISATLRNLSAILLKTGRPAEAEPLARRSLAVLEKTGTAASSHRCRGRNLADASLPVAIRLPRASSMSGPSLSMKRPTDPLTRKSQPI